jgi:5-methylcytosine-specific restriction endonuclease McrA
MTTHHRRELLDRIAASDATFERVGGRWTGKCLICNGRLSFDPRDGEGVNIEHIVPRSNGGGGDLANLALTHPRCNGEKGRNWDTPRARRARAEAYAALVSRLQRERAHRWRDPDATG